MCGQYSYLASQQELLARYQLEETESFELEEADVFYPQGKHPVLLPNQKIYNVQWGLVPSFAKRPLINARVETVLDKKTFREPFLKKRCIVPATRFYEWQTNNETHAKIRYEISLENLPIFSMAGICERYFNEDGSSYLTYAILTTEPNEQMRAIHDRMPVILEPDFEQRYLDLAEDVESLLPHLTATQRPLKLQMH